MNITLTPVLELEPYTFKNPDREDPLSYSTEIKEILPDKYIHAAHQLVWGDFIY